MKYYEVQGLINEGKIDDLRKKACNGSKERDINTYRDYYNGIQWASNGVFTDTTRSGRRVWKINSPDPRDLGVSDGDLAVFNVCSSTVDIYSSYARGSINDQNSLSIEEDQELASKINENINLDLIISRSISRMAVDSVAVWKFMEGGFLEFVDAIEVTPIYLEDNIVGTIRIYEISPDESIVKDSGIELKENEKAIYMEVWIPDGEKGSMQLYKYINQEEIESGVAPYGFNPFIYVPNKNNEFVKFDENNLEISDVAKIIPIQDSLNKTMTETGIIVSKVAFPIVKVIKEVYEKVLTGELNGDQLKKDLAKLSLVAGKIIAAPIEIESGAGLPNGLDSYVDRLYSQLEMITGIPRSIYTSEGLGNIADDTLSKLIESLKRKVDEKRANIENGIKTFVAMITGDPTIKDRVSIQWAEMLEMSKKDKADMYIKSKDLGMPVQYAVQGILDIMGDADRYGEILQLMSEADPNLRIAIETARARQDIAEEKNLEIANRDKKLEDMQKELQNTKLDNAMLNSELQKISSQS